MSNDLPDLQKQINHLALELLEQGARLSIQAARMEIQRTALLAIVTHHPSPPEVLKAIEGAFERRTTSDLYSPENDRWLEFLEKEQGSLLDDIRRALGPR